MICAMQKHDAGADVAAWMGARPASAPQAYSAGEPTPALGAGRGRGAGGAALAARRQRRASGPDADEAAASKREARFAAKARREPQPAARRGGARKRATFALDRDVAGSWRSSSARPSRSRFCVADESDGAAAEDAAADAAVEARAAADAARDASRAARPRPTRPTGRSAATPIVAVLGHVDHGKTTLLDALRGARTAEAEAGGITQRLSAFVARDAVGGGGGVSGGVLDTPGHAAFSKMRETSTRAVDIAVVVVAADDGVMPQTVEAVDHAVAPSSSPVRSARSAATPRAEAVARVRGELRERCGVATEADGGDVPSLARTGEGLGDLQEAALQSEVLDLRADADAPAEGVVVDTVVDARHGGTCCDVLVTWGGSASATVVVGGHYGSQKAADDAEKACLKAERDAERLENAKLRGLAALKAVHAERDRVAAAVRDAKDLSAAARRDRKNAAPPKAAPADAARADLELAAPGADAASARVAAARVAPAEPGGAERAASGELAPRPPRRSSRQRRSSAARRPPLRRSRRPRARGGRVDGGYESAGTRTRAR
ncbi:hypothetical protein JL720_15946 [Aureococcus anophagefferens]|nr:hypothetical protein JL720_15946 [Aureococcus anophagefferens]